MTWQRRPYIPGDLRSIFGGGHLREWGVRIERNHKTANILVINLGSWVGMKNFRKTPSGVALPDGGQQ